MSRAFSVIGLVLLGIVGAVAVLGYFAYGNEPKRSGTLTLAGLENATSIQWEEDGAVTIQAESYPDLFSALGYVHGTDHAWAMMLWRQAALGNLSQWLGADYVDYDRHARLLGFGALALESYEGLSADNREILNSYTRGANRALESSSAKQGDEFVLLDVEPEPWLPWHTLAVERMMAWIGTPSLAADSSYAAVAKSDSALVRFSTADSLFRSFLHLGGADQSRAWTIKSGESTIVAEQLAYGNSALPLIREITLRTGSVNATVATVPGTLMLPAGQSDERMWCVFLTSGSTLAPTDSLPPPPLFDRIVDRDGNEELLTFTRSPGGLYFKAEPPAPTPTAVLATVDSLGEAAVSRNAALADSIRAMLRSQIGVPGQKSPPAWLLIWKGFGTGTDLPAWLGLLGSADAPSFSLFRGDGLVTSAEGMARVLGAPPVRRVLPNGLFVAADSTAHFAANRLRDLLEADPSTANSGEPDPRGIVTDPLSPWAASLAPRLLDALGNRDSLDASIKDAFAFLRGWDYRYDRGSIAASIFEVWMREYRTKAQRLPTTTPDSGMTQILAQTLRDGIDELSAELGVEASAWRWEFVQPGTRYFPFWSDTFHGQPPEQFGPIRPSLGGHPTALLLGPSIIFGDSQSASVWTAWSVTSDWDRLMIYHPATRTSDYLVRELSIGELIPARAVRRDAAFRDPLNLRPSE